MTSLRLFGKPKISREGLWTITSTKNETNHVIFALLWTTLPYPAEKYPSLSVDHVGCVLSLTVGKINIPIWMRFKEVKNESSVA